MNEMNQIQLRRMLTSLGDATEATTWSALREAVIVSAVAVVGADSALVTGVGPDGPVVSTWPNDFLTSDQQSAFEQLHASDPWPLATNTRQGEGRPQKISDLYSRKQYRNLRIHSELFADLECDHQAAFAIVVDFRRRMCVAVNRSGRDFSSDDLEGLDALRRPLTACAARIAQLERLGIAPRQGRGTLSQRESDVLSLVAGGLTDDQVGRRLGISGRTVNKHLEHIYQKTGLRNRTQAAGRWHQMHAVAATPEQGLPAPLTGPNHPSSVQEDLRARKVRP
jgi:DNA-binding CsgD family transcriptional regulator